MLSFLDNAYVPSSLPVKRGTYITRGELLPVQQLPIWKIRWAYNAKGWGWGGQVQTDVYSIQTPK